MSKKFCVINQASGIGDILWEQKIAHHYNSLGYHVVWPIDPPYNMIGDYIDSPWCEFVKIHEDDYPFKNIWKADIPITWPEGSVYLPLAHINNHWQSEPIMHSKYTVLGIDWSDWKDYINYTPNEEKTNELRKIVNIPDGDYIFKNVIHNAPHCLSAISMGIQSETPIVELRMVEGFSVFDWIPIILDAKEVHTVDTGFCYLIEKLSTGQDLFMYERSPNIEYHIKGIFDRWNMVKFIGRPYEVSV